jgi:dolichol-phosphate mannosyltransferase
MMISLVIPVFNEETNVEEMHRRCVQVLKDTPYIYEMIFVDDGSTDGTLERLKRIALTDQDVKVLSFSRNFGHQSAVTAGLEHAIGDAAVIIDGDLQDPPELIPDMIDKWREGYHVVYAKRSRRREEGIFKKGTAFLFYRIFRSLTATKIPLDTGDFRLMDRIVVDAVVSMRERNRFVRGLVTWVGFRQTGVEFEREKRFSAETKYPMTKMIRFALNGIFSFSDKPLKIATFIGGGASAVGFIMILWGLYSKFFMAETTVKGWTSVFVAVLFLGGVQLFAIGIIGEYISRIYDECKGRPVYIIREKINYAQDTPRHNCPSSLAAEKDP